MFERPSFSEQLGDLLTGRPTRAMTALTSLERERAAQDLRIIQLVDQLRTAKMVSADEIKSHQNEGPAQALGTPVAAKSGVAMIHRDTRSGRFLPGDGGVCRLLQARGNHPSSAALAVFEIAFQAVL